MIQYFTESPKGINFRMDSVEAFCLWRLKMFSFYFLNASNEVLKYMKCLLCFYISWCTLLTYFRVHLYSFHYNSLLCLQNKSIFPFVVLLRMRLSLVIGKKLELDFFFFTDFYISWRKKTKQKMWFSIYRQLVVRTEYGI